MVISLSTICSTSIRDRIQKQHFPFLHLIPPTERQKLLDLVLINSTIYRPSVRQALSTPEFLSSMTSFDTQKGTIDDQKYLDSVAKSLAQLSPNGEAIGAGISKLELNIYGLDHEGDENNFVESNLDGVVGVIGNCPNLKALSLKLMGDYGSIGDPWHPRQDYANFDQKSGRPTSVFNGNRQFRMLGERGPHRPSTAPGLLNQKSILEPCRSVLENLESLSLIGFRGDRSSSAAFLIGNSPILQFRQLSSLHLANSNVDKKTWEEFLRSIQGTLIELEVERLYITKSDGGIIFPIPLPNLQSFKMDRWTWRTEELVKNLLKCPNLQFVSIALSEDNARCDATWTRMLNEIKATLELKVDFEIRSYNIDRYLNSQSRFKVVDRFGSKIKEMNFVVKDWNSRCTAALEHAVDVCTDLVALNFRRDDDDTNNMILTDSMSPLPVDEDLPMEFQKLNEKLKPIFADVGRARKLQRLSLVGSIDYQSLSSLFENGGNLKSLSIFQCPELWDDHLITWAAAGARPEEIRIRKCENVTDHGLIPVVGNSGDRLKVFIVAGANRGRVINRTFLAVMQNCRNVVEVNLPKRIKELYGRYFFNNVVQFCDYKTGRQLPFGEKRFNLEKYGL